MQPSVSAVERQTENKCFHGEIEYAGNVLIYEAGVHQGVCVRQHASEKYPIFSFRPT